MGFDAQNLTPSASLNRVRLMDLPGANIPGHLKGQIAYEWLGSEAIAARVRSKATELGLDGGLPASSLLPAFDLCFASVRPQVRGEATEIAKELGFYLACLVAILKRGDAINRAARADWGNSVWAHWGSIEQIWFGGGLVQGNLGRAMLDIARLELPKLGAEVDLERAQFPTVLPLIGAARSMPETTGAALVLDFGASWVKRGRASFARGALVELQVLPSVAAPSAKTPNALAEAMAQIISQSLQQVGQVSDWLEVSLAAYIQANRPVQAQSGLYVKLAELGPDSGAILAQKVREHAGRLISIELIHDGTAAARALPYTPSSAVIQMGTALGIGFPIPKFFGDTPKSLLTWKEKGVGCVCDDQTYSQQEHTRLCLPPL